MPETRIKKKQKNTNFTIIDNAVLTNSHLSFRARGILAMLLTLPEDWVVRKGWLYTQSAGEGRQAIDSAWKELTVHHHVQLRRLNEAGTGRLRHEIVVSEVPLTTPPDHDETTPATPDHVPSSQQMGNPQAPTSSAQAQPAVNQPAVNHMPSSQQAVNQQATDPQAVNHLTATQQMANQPTVNQQPANPQLLSTNQQRTNKQSTQVTRADDDDDNAVEYARTTSEWYGRVGKALGCYLNQGERAYVKKWLQQDGYSNAELADALAKSSLNHGKTIKYIDITLKNARKALTDPAFRVHEIPIVDIFHDDVS